MAGSRQFVPLGEQLEEQSAQESQSTNDRVIELINEAQLVDRDKKLECLHKVKELVIKKDPTLLDSFLNEVVAFQQDQSPDVRKFVIGFMEDACKTDAGMIVRVIPMVPFMMEDINTNVIKRLLVCIVQLYKQAFAFVSKVKVPQEDVQEMWEILQDLKPRVCDQIESDNDGVRTMAIKFMELLILCQTKKEPNSEAPKGSEIDISLDAVGPSHPLMDAAELREEAGTAMGSLLSLTASPSVSSVNLMACVGILASIAKQRPSNMSTVVQTFELLHANLPPHFAISQITSVRRQLKTQVLALLRHPSSSDCLDQITALLTDLGCSQAEIAKNTPKPETKRSREVGEGAVKSRPKVMELDVASASGERVEEKTTVGLVLMEAIEITSNDLKPLLTPEAVTELVIASMTHLPPRRPRTFASSYTPIAAAGTDSQVMHLARLLAAQMTTAGIGKGAKSKGIKPQSETPSPHSFSPVVRDPRKRMRDASQDETSGRSGTAGPGGAAQDDDAPSSSKKRKIKEEEEVEEAKLEQSMAELSFLGTLLGLPNILDPMFPTAYATFFNSFTDEAAGGETGGVAKTEETTPTPSMPPSSNLVAIPTTPAVEEAKPLVKKEKRKLQPAQPQKLKKIRQFDLSSVVKPLHAQQFRDMTVAAFKRILHSEKDMPHAVTGQARIKIIINLVTQFGGELNQALLAFILEDLRSHFDLAVAWMYAEYAIAEGYLNSAQNNLQYDSCLTGLLNGAREKLDARDRLFSRLLLEAPKVTAAALEIVRSYCSEEDRAFLGLTTLKDLVLRRPQGPQGSEDFLQAILEVTMSNLELARLQALHIAKKFYTKPELAPKIERFALQMLQILLNDHPIVTQSTADLVEVPTDWTEDSAKMCLGLFLSLLPLNHRLLKDLSIVYSGTNATVKRIILRQLDQPVRSIGMDSPELLHMIENCPPGGEILIMRMLHILTESAPPSPNLVMKVRELYHRNISEIRFLIPVLHGLEKQEVISALPKFIKLSPTVVKGVFDRLLGSYRGEQGHSMSPVSPSELLIALHNIECTNDESLMKATTKAIDLCFQERSVYTQEVLAVVLQQLLEQTPIPMLFMRTVIQSLRVCPKLSNFVMTILTKLISKQVWKQPKVWQGFIKCCEATKPHSFQVLLQLPQRQLENVLQVSPGIREPLMFYVQNFTPHQRAIIPRSLLQTIEREPDSMATAEAAKKPKKTKAEKSSRRESSSKRRRPSSRSDKETEQTEPMATS